MVLVPTVEWPLPRLFVLGPEESPRPTLAPSSAPSAATCRGVDVLWLRAYTSAPRGRTPRAGTVETPQELLLPSTRMGWAAGGLPRLFHIFTSHRGTPLSAATSVAAAVVRLRDVVLIRGNSALVCGSAEAWCRSDLLPTNHVIREGGDISINPEVAVEQRPRGGENTGSRDVAREEVHMFKGQRQEPSVLPTARVVKVKTKGSGALKFIVKRRLRDQ